jgi:predicted TPR repeat methyltransferase
MLEFSTFDRRRYPTVSVREGYREWVPSYEATVQDEMDLVLLEAPESVLWSAVERAADLGCGTGRTGVWLRTRGVARLDGIDLTPEMLEIARARAIYDRLGQADVAATGLECGAYDLVTTCLVDDISEI